MLHTSESVYIASGVVCEIGYFHVLTSLQVQKSAHFSKAVQDKQSFHCSMTFNENLNDYCFMLCISLHQARSEFNNSLSIQVIVHSVGSIYTTISSIQCSVGYEYT